MDWVEKIKGWLEKGKDRADTLIGLPWDISENRQDNLTVMAVHHPSVPFIITVNITESFAKLGIETDIETDFLEPTDRLKIYKTLLTLNGLSNLMKIGIIGVESKIAIFADLDLESLNKEEFNDALSALVMGAYSVYKSLGLEDRLNQATFQKLAYLAYHQLEEGKDPSEVVLYLSSRTGLEEKEAEEIVNSIMEMKKTKEQKEKEDGKLTYFG